MRKPAAGTQPWVPAVKVAPGEGELPLDKRTRKRLLKALKTANARSHFDDGGNTGEQDTNSMLTVRGQPFDQLLAEEPRLESEPGPHDYSSLGDQPKPTRNDVAGMSTVRDGNFERPQTNDPKNKGKPEHNTRDGCPELSRSDESGMSTVQRQPLVEMLSNDLNGLSPKLEMGTPWVLPWRIACETSRQRRDTNGEHLGSKRQMHHEPMPTADQKELSALGGEPAPQAVELLPSTRRIYVNGQHVESAARMSVKSPSTRCDTERWEAGQGPTYDHNGKREIASLLVGSPKMHEDRDSSTLPKVTYDGA